MSIADTQSPATPEPVGLRPPKRSRRHLVRRKPVRWFMIVSHRWLSLVLGVVLLLITTSGAVLVYRPELQRMLNHDAYAASGGARTVSFGQALATVEKAHPSFHPTGVIAEHGILKVTNADYASFWSVDPATGKILGHISKDPGWVAFLDNLHECFLSCEGETGYVSVLNKSVPGTAWLGFEGAKVTLGALVLGLFGLVLLYLCLTGLWLWFPRPRRWRSSVSIRWRKGRFARDTDLHKVGGMIVLVPLVVWAVTAAGFELGVLEKAWYAITPGKQMAHEDPAPSKKGTGSDIGIDAAVARAQATYRHDTIVSIDTPAAGDKNAPYSLWLSAGFDPYKLGEYPGDRGVSVDRRTGEVNTFYGQPGESTAQNLWDSWSYPVHSGYIVNGWWRLLWLVLGLSPLFLAWTGVSTWLVRLRSKRNRGAAEAARSART